MIPNKYILYLWDLADIRLVKNLIALGLKWVMYGYRTHYQHRDSSIDIHCNLMGSGSMIKPLHHQNCETFTIGCKWYVPIAKIFTKKYFLSQWVKRLVLQRGIKPWSLAL